MLEKNYRREIVLEDFNFGLNKKFNIKCGIDAGIFLVILGIFVSIFLKYNISLYEALIYTAIILLLYAPAHIITKDWISTAIKKSLSQQSDTVSAATSEMIEIFNSQKKIFENLAVNTKNIANMVERLKMLSIETVNTSKNTEKQINQSIVFSQKEH